MLRISHTKASTFRTCPKRYDFRYNKKYTPKREDHKLHMGRILHEGFEKEALGVSTNKVLEYIRSKFDLLIAGNTDPYREEDLLCAKYGTMGMYHFHRPARPMSSKPEYKFNVNLTPEVSMSGVVDALEKHADGWWLREYKSTGMEIQSLVNRLKRSYQGTAYVVAMEMEGLEINGIIYDIIRRPLIRKRKDETAQDFAERHYETYKDGGNASKLYAQVKDFISPVKRQQFMQDTVQDAEDILSTKYFKRNTDACFTYGKECEYARICFLNTIDPDLLTTFYEVEIG